MRQQKIKQQIYQSVKVSFDYPVCFTTGIFARSNALLKDILCAGRGDGVRKVLCVVDQEVYRHHPDLLDSIEAYFRDSEESFTLVAPPMLVEGGEVVKNDPSYVDSIQRAVHNFGIDRHSYMIAVGGGAVIDAAGYAAATAHRGVRLIRVPTTVLAQNDSAVGVKNSVNAYGKKNFLGTFAPPYAVVNDRKFLTTLSARDWLGGVSEAIKVALLKDAAFLDFVEARASDLVRRDMEAMEWVIYRCAQLHLDHIARSGDPFELGSSRPLDFGHWAAHKLEQLSNYEIRHGEAVAVGLALDSTYSYLTGRLPEEDWRRILRLISSLNLAVYVGELDLRDRKGDRRIISGLGEFREHLGGRLTVMLLEGIGVGVEVHEIQEPKVAESIELLKEHQKSSKGETLAGTRPHLSAHTAATR